MKGVKTKKKLPPEQREALLRALKVRFENNMNRHEGLEWAKVKAKLEANPEKLWSLSEMERTGGEPDVVGHDKKTGEYIFFDCSPESPKDRRSSPLHPPMVTTTALVATQFRSRCSRRGR
jgi:hypothetical protein